MAGQQFDFSHVDRIAGAGSDEYDFDDVDALAAGQHPRGGTLHEFLGGATGILRRTYESVRGSADAARAHLKEGNYPAALHDLAAPIVDPFTGAGLHRPTSRREAVSGALETAGVPAEAITEAAKQGNYPRAAGELVGAAALLAAPMAAERGIRVWRRGELPVTPRRPLEHQPPTETSRSSTAPEPSAAPHGEAPGEPRTTAKVYDFSTADLVAAPAEVVASGAAPARAEPVEGVAPPAHEFIPVGEEPATAARPTAAQPPEDPVDRIAARLAAGERLGSADARVALEQRERVADARARSRAQGTEPAAVLGEHETPIEVAEAHTPSDAATSVQASTSGGPRIEDVSPERIRVDASTYQFKGGGDHNGVTDRLQAVRSWDRLAGQAAPVLLHERANGDLFVVDGHQRVALAKRLTAGGEPVRSLRAIILSEADGVTTSQARRIGAMLNLQQGTGTAVDLAKVLREHPLDDIERARIPKDHVSGTKLRTAEDLAQLGDAAFLEVVNGRVHPNPAKNEAYAAIVGRLLADPTEQYAALRELAVAAPDSAYEAQQFIQAVRSAGFERGEQTDLFGTHQTASSLAAPIAKVMAAARRTLHSERSALGNAVRNEARLARRGNVLDRVANQAGVDEAATLDRLLDTYGHTAGPVREELKNAAASLQRGELSAAEGASRVLDALERERHRLGGQRDLSPALHRHDAFAGSPPAAAGVAAQTQYNGRDVGSEEALHTEPTAGSAAGLTLRDPRVTQASGARLRQEDRAGDVRSTERKPESAGQDQVCTPPFVSTPGERGSIRFGSAQPPYSAADVRSPNPVIEARFEPPSPAVSLARRLREGAAGVREALGRAFSFEYDLHRAGLDDAVDRIDAFNRERADAPKQVIDRLSGVLAGLTRPEQYHLFQRIIMLRRDLELADAMQQGRIPKTELESGLTPLEARAELNRLSNLAGHDPAVDAAVGRHRQMVRAIGDDLVERNLMQAETRDRNADYFPALVLEHLRPNASLVGRAASPLTPGARGFLKQARGGARETVRDYIDAMSRHLAEVKHATMRDDLVKDLAGRYDRNPEVLAGAEPPRGHSLWMYGDRAYLIPDALRDRLTKFTQRTPDEVRALNRVTSWWKGATLRVLGVPFDVLNFTGDLVNYLAGEPVLDVAKAPRRLKDAAVATWLKTKPTITTNDHLHDLQMLAHLADRLNLGSGGATAEVGHAVAQRPELRELRRPLGETPARRLARLPGDVLTRMAAAQDAAREFRESVPRLAKFMAEVERGQTPDVAARVARRELVDYTRLTDFERVWMRGALMPFYTWFKKNAENWLPGIRRAADGSRTRGALEASIRIGKVMAPAYAVALYNEMLFPDAEKNLPEGDRDRFHVLVPWKGGVLYLGFTGPANAAAGLVGLQGFTQRSLDLVRGRATLGEEADRSVRQVRNNLLGLITPLTEPIEQLANADLRTGRPIVPNVPLTAQERLTRRLEHAADRFAPVSQLTRSAAATTGWVIPDGNSCVACS